MLTHHVHRRRVLHGVRFVRIVFALEERPLPPFASVSLGDKYRPRCGNGFLVNERPGHQPRVRLRRLPGTRGRSSNVIFCIQRTWKREFKLTTSDPIRIRFIIISTRALCYYTSSSQNLEPQDEPAASRALTYATSNPYELQLAGIPGRSEKDSSSSSRARP